MLRRVGMGLAGLCIALAATAGPAGAGVNPTEVYLDIYPDVCCLDFPVLTVAVDYTCSSAQVAAGERIGVSVLLRQGGVVGKGSATGVCEFEGIVHIEIPSAGFTSGPATASATANTKPSGGSGSTARTVTIGHSS